MAVTVEIECTGADALDEFVWRTPAAEILNPIGTAIAGKFTRRCPPGCYGLPLNRKEPVVRGLALAFAICLLGGCASLPPARVAPTPAPHDFTAIITATPAPTAPAVPSPAPTATAESVAQLDGVGPTPTLGPSPTPRPLAAAQRLGHLTVHTGPGDVPTVLAGEATKLATYCRPETAQQILNQVFTEQQNLAKEGASATQDELLRLALQLAPNKTLTCTQDLQEAALFAAAYPNS